MKLILVIPIYRNKFQKVKLFYSTKDFSIGSIIFVPFNRKEKPAVVLKIDDLKEMKTFIRKSLVEVQGLKSKIELPVFKKGMIDFILKIDEKKKISVQEILNKILNKKIKQVLNKIKEDSDLEKIKEDINKITAEVIKKKLFKKKENKRDGFSRGATTIKSVLEKERIRKKSLHSEIHYLVDEIRDYFGETAKKGKGSFGFYLGFFNRIPKHLIYQYWSEVKGSKKSIKSQQKIFWWKIGKYLKK